jgi:SAM-dependent methyltransferase
MFDALINRSHNDTEWRKIPWDDPDFSRRMLAEHLSQAHDLASRRQTTIDRHVAWIHRAVLNEQPARILDLGCGPGFYTGRLTALGHTCTGLDFSPASIAYAQEHHPASRYTLGDVRELDYGAGYDLVMMVFGEINAFAPEDAARIIAKAHAALKPGGRLLLEAHPFAFVFALGQEASSWHTAQRGLFADEPYLCLTESRYAGGHASTDYYVFLAESGAMTRYTSMLHACTDNEYRRLLGVFTRVVFHPALAGDGEPGDLFVIVAEK